VPENWQRSNWRHYSGPAHDASSSGSSGSSSSSAAVVGNVGATQGSASQANRLLPGATVATLLMLGALHARRLYEDSKIEEQKRQGKELEFAPDWKATFLQVLPLRFISRVWGSMTSLVCLPLLCLSFSRIHSTD
jgi:phosphatidylserine decarboxylase